LNTAKHIISEVNLRTLYLSLFHSHLMYGILLWGTTYQKFLHPLEILQKKAIRTITHSPYNSHTSGHFQRLNILWLHDLANLEIVKFMYLFSISALPKQLNAIFQTNDNVPTYITRYYHEARVPTLRARQTSNSLFLCIRPDLWHNLLPNVKLVVSYEVFKHKVTSHYISAYQQT
jgi:hypothetical protein